jgi:hypothetical protein
MAAFALAAQLVVLMPGEAGVSGGTAGVWTRLSTPEAQDVFRLDNPGGWLIGLYDWRGNSVRNKGSYLAFAKRVPKISWCHGKPCKRMM